MTVTKTLDEIRSYITQVLQAKDVYKRQISG